MSEMMPPIGRTARLRVSKSLDFGVYLVDELLGEVLLPKSEVPRGCAVGDWLQVFLYKDSKDVAIATTRTPLATVGTCAYPEVVAVDSVGAFLNWGLPKDLFVPFAEQKRRMEVGRFYTVFVYLDNTGRIAATPRLQRHLSELSEVHRAGQPVELLICGRTDLGYRAAIDDTHLGLLFDGDVFEPIVQGQRYAGFIKELREDGKLTVCLRLDNEESRDALGEQLVAYMRERGGSMAFNDKSPPEQIYKAFGVSKKVFKRALGQLYREKRVLLEEQRVSLVKPTPER